MVKSSKEEMNQNQLQNDRSIEKENSQMEKSTNKTSTKTPSSSKKILPLISTVIVLGLAGVGATVFAPKLTTLLEDFFLPVITTIPEEL